MIRETFETFAVEELSYQRAIEPRNIQRGFVFKLRLSKTMQKEKSQLLLEVPGMLTIRKGVLSKESDFENLTPYQLSECYFSYADCHGNSEYLSASIWLNWETFSEQREMSIGIPLNLYSAYDKDVYLFYDEVHFGWIVNGEMVNVNYPLGQLDYAGGEVFVEEKAFEEISCCTDVQNVAVKSHCEDTDRSIAFYSPRGYNEWVGDTMNFYHDGVYHLLFLKDRHHHGNRFSGGAHNVIHLTTKDFVNWENHGVMYPLEAQWQTFGTGTMFYYDNKYYFSYGYHSSRSLPKYKLASGLLKEEYEKSGEVTALSYTEMDNKGLFPAGANYLVSDDGIHFKRSNMQFHWSENPSIYASEEGLSLYAGYGGEGVWKATDINGPWRLSEEESSIYHLKSPIRNSSECPSKFTWGDYNYLLMGFTGFWQKKVEEDTYVDMALQGKDLYDGLSVPMVANCNGRYILSGWINGYGWGFLLQQRELVQKTDGTLGMRWLPELTPDVSKLHKVAFCEHASHGQELSLDSKRSYYLTCNIQANTKTRIGFSFSGEGTSCVLQLDSQKQKVQIREVQEPKDFAEELPALYEVATTFQEEILSFRRIPGVDWHFKGHDFSIGQVEELLKPYQIKMILHYEPKTDSIVIDVEIEEGRTLISNRRYFKADTLRVLCEHGTVSDFQLYEL